MFSLPRLTPVVAFLALLLLGAVSPAPALAQVDLNSASFSQLEAVDGISSAMAQKIIANRPLRSKRALVDRLVEVDLAVADLQVEAAPRVGAHPRLVVDRRALSAEVGERDQRACVAGVAAGPGELFQAAFLFRRAPMSSGWDVPRADRGCVSRPSY